MKTSLSYSLMINAFLLIILVVITRCKKCEHAPFATSYSATFITQTGATLNGSVDAIGLNAIVTFEFGESTSYGQTMTTTQHVNGLIIPVFIDKELNGLTAETTYHYRIKAEGPCRTTYGSDVSFTTLKDGDNGIIFNQDLTFGLVNDIEGNAYKTIQIGAQIWMAENLRTSRLNDGTPIQLVTNTNQWVSQKTPAYCWYNNNTYTYRLTVGALYNWSAVNAGNLCPTGWHVPTVAEWTSLIDYLGGVNISLDKIKETGTSHWIYQKPGATNSSGFTALPGGSININTDYNVSNYYGIGTRGNWWSSTERIITDAWILDIYISSNIYDLGSLNFGVDIKQDGNSVRCLRDY